MPTEDLILNLVRAIVRYPEYVAIETISGRETTVLSVSVAPEDKGHLIGREGRTIDAIQHLFAKAGTLSGKRIIVTISERSI